MGPFRAFGIVAALVLLPATLWALPTVRVDRAEVTVEKRAGKEWCVLNAQVSAECPTTIDALMRVIEDYQSYPQLFPEIRETKVVLVPGAALVTERVVISALGIENTNRFTLRLVRTDAPASRSVRLSWTQDWTDGTIDSLGGEWILEDRGTSAAPLVAVTYRARSAIPVLVPGQSGVIGMFLGGKTQGILDAVFKKVLSR